MKVVGLLLLLLVNVASAVSPSRDGSQVVGGLSRSRSSSQTRARSSSRSQSIEDEDTVESLDQPVNQEVFEDYDEPVEQQETDELLGQPTRDEEFKKFREERDVVKVVRRDTIQNCTPKLHAKLLGGFYGGAFGKKGLRPKKVVGGFRKKMKSASSTKPTFFLGEARPVTDRDACILETEFYLVKVREEDCYPKIRMWNARPEEEPYGLQDDIKPIVNLSDPCYIQQTLYTIRDPITKVSEFTVDSVL